MRFLMPLLALNLVACSFGEQQTQAYDPDPVFAPEAPLEVGFMRLADTSNPGNGVTPDLRDIGGQVVPSGWASMGDRLCEIDGLSGDIAQDIFLEEPPADGDEPVHLLDSTDDLFVIRDGFTVSVIDNEGVGVHYPTMGRVEAAQMSPDGRLNLLTSTPAGCMLSERNVTGEPQVLVSESTCEGARLELDADNAWVSLNDRIFQINNLEIVNVSPGSILSVDPTTGIRLTAKAGSQQLHVSAATDFLLDLPGNLVDAAVRGDHIVALTDTPELLLLDATTGKQLAQQPYFGSLAVDRLQLTDDGRGLIATSDGDLKFYEVRSQR